MIRRIHLLFCLLTLVSIYSQTLRAHQNEAGGSKIMRILAVGNSWSLNATNYVGNIMDELGYDTKISVCYAGGATLQSYWQNILNDKAAYELHTWEDGEWSRPTTLHTYKEILLSDSWDIIFHQQQSGASGIYSSFQPFLDNMIKWERETIENSPLIALHATWAYPSYNTSTQFESYYGSNSTTMYNAVIDSYNQAMVDENIKFVIPSTPMIQQSRELGVPNIDTSDGSHLTTNGFFAAACIWTEMLLSYYLGSNHHVSESSFVPYGLSLEHASAMRALAIRIANEISSYFQHFDPKGLVFSPGDVNHSEIVDISDVLLTVDYILGHNIDNFHIENADLNEDEKIDISDVLSIVDVILGKNDKKSLHVEYTNPEIIISEGPNFIKGTFNKTQDSPYDGNPIFNFTDWKFANQRGNAGDDVAPMHVQNTTLGGNHGQPCQKATIESHGLTNTSIGSEWVSQDGTKFYIMRIADADHIIFLSENKGTEQNHSFVPLNKGILKNNERFLQIEEVVNTQLRPSVININHSLLKDGVTKISEPQSFNCSEIEIIEEYDIINTAQVLQNIISSVPSSSDPIYTSSPMVHVKNKYRFTENLSCIVISSVEAKQKCAFYDLMFSQAGKISTGTVSYYIPGSLPTSNYDLTTPTVVNWDSSIPSFFLNSTTWEKADCPVNRVIQIGENAGLAIGFLPFEVGKDLTNYTKRTFEIRNETGKIYPHGVESSVIGNTLNPNDHYSAILYRCYFDAKQPEGRISMYHFNYNGEEYLFSDYSQAITDVIALGKSFNGKKITVIDSNNASLISDIYKGGACVKSTPVNGSTSYIVVKIS